MRLGRLGLLLPTLVGCAMVVGPMRTGPTIREATGDEIRAFFRAQPRQVVTFIGYSGAGYEDEDAMLRHAEAVLAEYDPSTTIVNVGATAMGIGAVYPLAKRRGFMTTGIVSTQARDEQAELSPDVDHVWFVRDDTWGGLLPGTDRLSPTSAALVENSDVVVGIGGGEVGRDEMLAAQRAGKKVRFIPADMNHRAAIEKARKKGQPAPTDFSGPIDDALLPASGSAR